MWRALGLILNPLGALFIFVFGWLGRKIDSWLSPLTGLVAAILVGLWALSVSAGLLFSTHDQIGRASGLVEPPPFTRVTGRVEAILGETTLTRDRIRQHLLVSYQAAGERREFDDHRSVRRDSAAAIGDRLPVYLVEDRGPSLDTPHDATRDIIVTAIAVGVSLLVSYWAWRYGRYRWRIFAGAQRRPRRPATAGSAPVGRPSEPPAAPQPVVLRGREQPLSTAARMQADAERVQRATAQGTRR